MHHLLLERKIMQGIPEACQGCTAPRAICSQLAEQVVASLTEVGIVGRSTQETSAIADAQATANELVSQQCGGGFQKASGWGSNVRSCGFGANPRPS